MSGPLTAATLDAILEEHGLTLQQLATLCAVDYNYLWIVQRFKKCGCYVAFLCRWAQLKEWNF